METWKYGNMFAYVARIIVYLFTFVPVYLYTYLSQGITNYK